MERSGRKQKQMLHSTLKCISDLRRGVRHDILEYKISLISILNAHLVTLHYLASFYIHKKEKNKITVLCFSAVLS